MTRNEYFSKYLKGTATPDEQAIVTAWVTGLIERAAAGIASKEEEEIVRYWLGQEPGLINNMREVTSRKNATKTVLNRQILADTTPLKTQSFYRYAAAASVLLLIAFGAFLVSHNDPENSTAANYFPPPHRTENSIITYETYSNSSITKLQLPDSSFIFLNANASLSLDSARFNRQSREIRLLDGEGFFQVAKNKEKKFLVRFGHLQLEVVGTSFNIEHYKNKKEKRVFVKTGQVVIKDEESVIATLTPQQTFIYNDQTKNYAVSKDNPTDLSQWIEGKLIFAGADWPDIEKKMKAHFGIQLLIENDALPSPIQLNAVFNKEDDELKIAQVIAGIYGVRFRTAPGKIIFYR